MDRVARLRGEVAALKATIRRARADLGRKKAELAALECGRLGIGVVMKGEGEASTHGREDFRRTRS
jgi:hypothetical protein